MKLIDIIIDKHFVKSKRKLKRLQRHYSKQKNRSKREARETGLPTYALHRTHRRIQYCINCFCRLCERLLIYDVISIDTEKISTNL